METMDQSLIDEETQNWYQCNKALDIARCGLLPFVKREIQDLHARILRNANNDIRDEIKKIHQSANPTFKNIDFTKLNTDEWQLAKCFMSAGYKKVATAEDTDLVGILSIVINCKCFRTKVDDTLFEPTNVLKELRDVINDEVRHSPELKVSKDTLTHVVDLLMSILSEPKILKGDQSAQEAKETLMQLQTTGVVISTHNFLRWIEEKLKLGLIQINKIQEERLSELIEEQAPGHSFALYGNVSAAPGAVAIGNVQKVGAINITSSGNAQLTPDKQAKLQRRLIQFYVDQYSAVPVSMLDQSFDAPLRDLFVNPNIRELKRCGSETLDVTPPECIRTYKALFVKRKIFLQGEPGMGKTTFLTKLAMDWCKAHDPKVELVSGESDMFFTDIETLRRFKFLFFVSLREMNGVKCDMRDEIKDFIGLDEIDDGLWDEECLEVGDALDEWTHPNTTERACKCSSDRNLPCYRKLGNITRIFSSRPWKLSKLQISDTTEKKFEITGINDPLQLTQKVVAHLNTIPKTRFRLAKDFDTMIQQTDMAKLMNKPVIAMRLIHQWHIGKLVTNTTNTTNTKTRKTTQCTMYANMVDMLIGQAFNKDKSLSVAHSPRSLIKLPTCFESCEHIKDNQLFIATLCKLAFNTLLQKDKSLSIIFKEESITALLHDHTNLGFASGILTKKKPIGLNISKHHPCMFLHKTMQEFLAALEFAIANNTSEELIDRFKIAFDTVDNVLDCSQLFLFACGLQPDLAGKFALHITSLIRNEYKRLIDENLPINLDFLKSARDVIMKGVDELPAENCDIQKCIKELNEDLKRQELLE